MPTVNFHPNDNTVAGGPSGYTTDPSVPFLTNPPRQASGIGLDPKLTAILRGIGTTQKNKIGGIYGNMRAQLGADDRPTAATPGSYADSRLTATQGLSEGNLSSGLEGVLGGEGYTDAKNQRDFEQNMGLAKYTGALNKPSALEQALAGLSGGAQIGGQGYALYNDMKKNSKNKPRASYNPYSQDTGSDYVSDDEAYA